jgi:hypothetical protein
MNKSVKFGLKEKKTILFIYYYYYPFLEKKKKERLIAYQIRISQYELR